MFLIHADMRLMRILMGGGYRRGRSAAAQTLSESLTHLWIWPLWWKYASALRTSRRIDAMMVSSSPRGEMVRMMSSAEPANEVEMGEGECERVSPTRSPSFCATRTQNLARQLCERFPQDHRARNHHTRSALQRPQQQIQQKLLPLSKPTQTHCRPQSPPLLSRLLPAAGHNMMALRS